MFDRSRLLSDRSRRPYHYNSQVHQQRLVLLFNHHHHHQNHHHRCRRVHYDADATQVDLQGQPMAGTVEADPVEEAHYRRSGLKKHGFPRTNYSVKSFKVKNGHYDFKDRNLIFHIYSYLPGTSTTPDYKIKRG